MSDASMLVDFLRGGVNGSFSTPGLALRSSSLFTGTFKGVRVSELLDESDTILSLSLSDSSTMKEF
jgi:hypothetical protein